MKIYSEKNYEQMSRTAAQKLMAFVHNRLDEKEYVVFVPSAGGTPTRLYELLAAAETGVDWSRVIICQMDEYVALPPQHPNSLADYLFHHVIRPLGIDNYYFLNDTNGRCIYHGAEYDQLLDELGGIDVFVHGIGENGHLGFNEPGTAFDSKTHRVTLTESTRMANSRFFKTMSDVPLFGMTMGLSTIFSAHTHFVLASGERKQTAVRNMIMGERNRQNPASVLQNHSRTFIFMDTAAAGELSLEKLSQSPSARTSLL